MKPLRLPLVVLLVLLTMSVSMTVVCMGYGVENVNVPYPDPTPAQAAAQKYHTGVLDWLMLSVGLSWLVTFGVAVGLGMRRVAERKRNRTEDVG